MTVQMASVSYAQTGYFTLATFGQWLAGIRQKRGWSQRSLAAKAGISSAMISKLESDSVGLSIKMIEKIADALEVDRVIAKRAWAESKNRGELPKDALEIEVVTVREKKFLASYRGAPTPGKRAAEAMLDAMQEAMDEESLDGIRTVKNGDHTQESGD